MAFGKSVGAEALDLAKAGLGECARIAASDHPFHHFGTEFVDRADVAERGHGATQLVGFLGREFRGVDGNAHGLFLEQRHAEGFSQHTLQFVCWAEFRRG